MSKTAIATKAPAAKAPAKNAVAVVSPQRALEAKLTSEGREKLKKLRQLTAKGNKDHVLSHYDIGAIFNQVLQAEARYGVDSYNTICQLTGLKASMAVQTAKFSSLWSRTDVEKSLVEAEKLDFTLSVSHWLQVSTLSNAKERRQALDIVLKEKISASHLETRLAAAALGTRVNRRGGGRKPQLHKDPLDFLQQARQGAVKQNRFNDTAIRSDVFAKLADIPQKKLTADVYGRVKELDDQLGKSIDMTRIFREKVAKVRRRMAERLHIEEDAADEDEIETPGIVAGTADDDEPVEVDDESVEELIEGADAEEAAEDEEPLDEGEAEDDGEGE